MLKSENVNAYVMLSEDMYTPKIELKSDIPTLSSFVAQATTKNNYGVHIVDLYDTHICDVTAVDMGVFEELKFLTDTDLDKLRMMSDELYAKCNTFCIVIPDCTIQKVEYRGRGVATTVIKLINTDYTIVGDSILDSVGFWSKIGVEFEEGCGQKGACEPFILN